MSHDVLDERRRRLVGGPDSPEPSRDERREDGGSPDAASAPATLTTDGGERQDPDDEHLRDLPDGAGCTEIWEHLSERQAEATGATERESIECRADD